MQDALYGYFSCILDLMAFVFIFLFMIQYILESDLIYILSFHFFPLLWLVTEEKSQLD